MKILRSFLSIALALVLLLNMIPPARAVEGDPGKLTMTASDTAVSHGDTVTVTISASQSFMTRGAGMTIAYDAAVLEPVEHTAAEPFQISGPMTVQGRTVLRISFLPGSNSHTFTADQALAVLAFKAIAPAESTGVEMTAAYLYDSALDVIQLDKAETVEVGVRAVAVTGISLNLSTLDVELGETAQLTATITPANASDQTITWTSSDESVATVVDGKVAGVGIGTATITAQAGGFSAECTVTVKYPPDVGYTVTMPEDKTAVVGDTVTIPAVISNADGINVYNAFDITFAYDPAMLKLVTTEIQGMTVAVKEGTVNVLGYGPDREIDTAPFTLTFQTLKTGETTVTVTDARVDQSENAVTENTAKATLLDEETKITVGGYPVSLPDDFTGDSVVEPGEDYTFTAKAPYYDYTFDGSTMGGQSVTIKDNSDGTFTIENVTGKVIIQTLKTGKSFDVVLGTDMTGNSQAQYMTDYTAVIHKDSGYTYSVSITIGGKSYSGYSTSGDSYTIPGKDITGEIRFNVVKTPVTDTPDPVTYCRITFEGSGAGAAEGNASTVVSGSSYSFTLNKEDGYRYSVSYKMGGGEEASIRPDENGTYTISNVSGNLTITVIKELDEMDYSIEVYNYITLNNGKIMYLVLISGGLDDSKIFTYGESPMYFSEVYNACCILTVESSKLTAGLARKQIGNRKGQMDVVRSADYDVNMTGLVDINDAQLVYDMYNGKYEDFTTINMHRFLNADVNADKKITVTDAAAVVSAIK